jgi:hypothetical protein
MLVDMLRRRSWQNAGREEWLDTGGRYDLPAVVATALIATGAAVGVVLESMPVAVSTVHLPGAPETGTRRRRHA